MNILVTGANGQLGSELKLMSQDFPNFNFHFTDVDDLDISDREIVPKYLENKNFSFIINCAAYTAVDKAEDDQDKAFLLNQTAVRNLVASARNFNAKLIHISTDYVFDGKSYFPYKESHKTNPFSIYGKSKLAGEQEIIGGNANAIIIRTSWLYSEFGNNFVKTIHRLATERDQLGVIFDQIGTPTNAKDLAKFIIHIIEKNNTDIFEQKEIYHFSNEGVCSWFDFAKKIVELKKLNCKIIPIETIDYPTPAPRPHYSLLNKKKIKGLLNSEIPHWEDSLKEMLDNI
jgi:dTDP-4-dehydrorhamnose reductase